MEFAFSTSLGCNRAKFSRFTVPLARYSRLPLVVSQRPREDSNLQPSASEAESSQFLSIQGERVTIPQKSRYPERYPSEQTNDYPDRPTTTGSQQAQPNDGDFAKALLMIATLPLTDTEKAEAVRRMMNRKESV